MISLEPLLYIKQPVIGVNVKAQRLEIQKPNQNHPPKTAT